MKVARKSIPVFAGLIAGNIAAWAWALALFGSHPALLGTALLAYTLGLRHAVDADHIAAIDNVTRKLMQRGQRPVTVGLWFSLGHSSVVVLAAAGIALASVALRDRFAAFHRLGDFIGTGISASFLFLIALANIAVLISIARNVQAPAELPGGFISRLLRPLMRLISNPRHMYPLGFLFGLGFDTASEIALLGISASHASQAVPLWSILVFPALFTAGMSLLDTADGVMMLGAYGWAFEQPGRKRLYNFSITLASVVIALVVGAVEALDLVARKLPRASIAPWASLPAAGFFLILFFAGCWGLSFLIQRTSDA